MKRLLLFLFCTLLLAVPARGVDVTEEQVRQFGLDGLEVPEGAKELLPDVSPTDPGGWSESLGSLLTGGLSRSGGFLREAVRTAASMLAVALLCSMVTQLEGKRAKDAVLLAGTLAIALLGVGGFRSMVAMGRETLAELRSFSMLLLPALSTATAASGGIASGGAVYAASIFVSDILNTLIDKLLIPLLYAFLAISTANAALREQNLTMLRDLIKRLLTSGLKLIVFAFTAYIGLSGVISGAGDAAAVRAAKLTLSTVVPVVGGMISDASETVLVSARMLKNGAGIFGMLAVLGVCLLPLIRLGIQHLILKLTAALCATVTEKPLSGMIDSISDSLGFLMAMTAAAGFMLLISCVAFLKVVSV